MGSASPLLQKAEEVAVERTSCVRPPWRGVPASVTAAPMRHAAHEEASRAKRGPRRSNSGSVGQGFECHQKHHNNEGPSSAPNRLVVAATATGLRGYSSVAATGDPSSHAYRPLDVDRITPNPRGSSDSRDFATPDGAPIPQPRSSLQDCRLTTRAHWGSTRAP